MNSFTPRSSQPINWSAIVRFAWGFWLSASLVLDLLVIPGLLKTGMMNEAGFASASYLIFGTFNHVELLCAAVVLAGFLVFQYGDRVVTNINHKSVVIAGLLLIIALVYTYILIPQMSSMGMTLDTFESTRTLPSSMMTMHITYWSLEVIKLLGATILLRNCYRNSCSLV